MIIYFSKDPISTNKIKSFIFVYLSIKDFNLTNIWSVVVSKGISIASNTYCPNISFTLEAIEEAVAYPWASITPTLCCCSDNVKALDKYNAKHEQEETHSHINLNVILSIHSLLKQVYNSFT